MMDIPTLAICLAAAAAAGDSLPPFTAHPANPVITGNNVFAPHLHRVGAAWWCYFGGWLRDGQTNDTIYLVRSDSGALGGPWSEPRQLIAPGAWHMANDPTVARDADGRWHMLYTLGNLVAEPPPLFDEWIGHSTSEDGVHWSPAEGSADHLIAIEDPDGIAPGDLTGAARPSLVRDGNTWRLWFDGDCDEAGMPSSYLAVCDGPAPTRFRLVHRYPAADGFFGFWEPDVAKRPDGTFVAVVQRHFKTVYAGRSQDGVHFDLEPVLRAGEDIAAARVSNPAVAIEPATGRIAGILFGMTDHPALLAHDIGAALPEEREGAPPGEAARDDPLESR
jgi:hypothetical protein